MVCAWCWQYKWNQFASESHTLTYFLFVVLWVVSALEALLCYSSIFSARCVADVEGTVKWDNKCCFFWNQILPPTVLHRTLTTHRAPLFMHGTKGKEQKESQRQRHINKHEQQARNLRTKMDLSCIEKIQLMICTFAGRCSFAPVRRYHGADSNW